jgi:hypothetical protein
MLICNVIKNCVIFKHLLHYPSCHGSGPRRTVEVVPYLKQILFLGYVVLQLFCGYCIRYMLCCCPASHGLRLGSAAARLMGLRLIIPSRTCISVMGVVCFQVEASATGRSLVQRGPTEYDVSESDSEASMMIRPWLTGGCRVITKYFPQ